MFGLLKRRTQNKGRIGLALERDKLAVAVVTREGAQIKLNRCEVLPVAVDGGTDAVSAAIRTASLPKFPASAVLRAEEYQLALLEAPDVPAAELRAAMRWRLKDAIDFRLEEAVIDVFDIPAPHRGGQGRMMYAVAARRAAVDRWASAVASVVAFDVVDVPELCLRNLAAAIPNAAAGLALLHLGETAATVILVRGGTFYFARQMDLRANQRSAAGRDAGATFDSAGIVLELQRSLDYYERHFDQPPITRIVISPDGPRARALAGDLNQDTGFDVSALDLNTLLECDSPMDSAIQAVCLMAVGAALREERLSL